jgi:hypothetical protein
VELYLVCVGVADEQELEGVGQHDATVLALVVAGLGDLDLRRRGVGLGRRRRRLGRRLGWVSARGLERKWGGVASLVRRFGATLFVVGVGSDWPITCWPLGCAGLGQTTFRKAQLE